MPEGIEIEYYRRAAEAGVGRPIVEVHTPDAWYLKGDATAEEIAARLVGSSFGEARRIGKLLLLDIDDGGALGLRFGMTGRLLIDGGGPIDRLEYSSDRNDPAWDRFAVTFDDGGVMSMRDPRRLGGVALDPDESALGADLYTITGAQLGAALAGSDRPLKARLLDQKYIAGLGNLLTDEILWRAGLDPRRPANGLDQRERRRLLHHLRRVVDELTERGGSHTGDLQDHRYEGALCPRDEGPLERHTIGGRTTYACAVHQTGKDHITA